MRRITHRNTFISGMTTTNAVCGIAGALAVTTQLVVAGTRVAVSGINAMNIIMIVLNVAMFLLMLFVAWNTGRASVRRDGLTEASAPGGGHDNRKPDEPVAA